MLRVRQLLPGVYRLHGKLKGHVHQRAGNIKATGQQRTSSVFTEVTQPVLEILAAFLATHCSNPCHQMSTRFGLRDSLGGVCRIRIADPFHPDEVDPQRQPTLSEDYMTRRFELALHSRSTAGKHRTGLASAVRHYVHLTTIRRGKSKVNAPAESRTHEPRIAALPESVSCVQRLHTRSAQGGLFHFRNCRNFLIFSYPIGAETSSITAIQAGLSRPCR